ncbi:hypothetical protein [uncultured Brevundimonas sp.]|uniref:hypothetical protein n=1 Tax=uncultured Brevundimonas sp. TaxID=213418 RepID=UPI002636AE6D|nr:hypothetical protein [uncultured Brevundimonas sp.]
MSNRKLVVIGLIALALLALALVGRTLLTRGSASDPTAQPSELVAAIRTHFPEDWKAIERQRKDAATDDATLGAAFLTSKLRDVAQAPDEAIIDILKVDAALANTLKAEDVALCASFAAYGPTEARRYSPEAMVLLDRIAAKTVIAARKGMDTPTPRTIDPQQAFSRLQTAMLEKGVSPRLADQARTTPLDTAEQCEAGIQTDATLLALPPAQAANIFVALKYPQN